jgi:transcriptional regulator with XRE-family HTH domain
VAEQMLVSDAASSGVAELDAALGGIYWGDNVVWELEEGVSADPFYAAIASTAASYQGATFVTTSRPPSAIEAELPGLAVLDASPGTPLSQPGALLTAVTQLCRAGRRDLVLFDSLDAFAERWGAETAVRFFTRTCPMLLELSAIAYWAFTPSLHPATTRREIEDTTQCVFALGDARLRIAKAEGRSPGIQGSVFRYRVEDGLPHLEPAPAAARLGAALLALRTNRGLSQTELARLAGVSPSAISQAERAQRGLSLETLLELTAKLGIPLDELLRGEVAPGYRLGRRHDPLVQVDGRALALLDDPAAGLRSYLVRLPPESAASPPFMPKGVEMVAVAHGLVQVVLPTGRPVLREGETLLVEHSRVASWRNIGDREATLFWILRDETGPAALAARPD